MGGGGGRKVESRMDVEGGGESRREIKWEGFA